MMKSIESAQEAPKPPAIKTHTRLEENRVSELLDIATEVFIQHGFEGASTNDIARKANCSKTTLYSRFPTKEKLFLAVLERRMEYVFRTYAIAFPMDAPLETTLKEYGARLLQLVMAEDQLALMRVVSMESPRFPELGERFYELGPGRGVSYLAAYMAEQVQRGRLLKEDPETMAQHLISLITGGQVRWAVLGLFRRNMTSKEVQLHIDAVVGVFLRAYSTSQQRKADAPSTRPAKTSSK
jgi:TetR/AcrR family transcriptional regulator, mexJK operon transcriptional repressor